MSQLDVFSLEGRVALIPGGGGAIGSAIAAALAGAGARVAVVDVTDERAEAAAATIRETGAEVLALGADVTNEAECERIVTATVERFGRLDIVVNCVGGGAGKVLFDAEEYPRDAWDWIYELNVRSTLLATQAAVKAMKAAGRGGRVVNISSVRASLGINAGYSAYVAAKGAISSLTASGPPSGRSTGSPSTRSPPPSWIRRRWRCCSTTRRSRRASSAESPSAGSAGRATSPAPSSSSAPTPPRSSPARSSGSTAG